jgi:hypothetical protein
MEMFQKREKSGLFAKYHGESKLISLSSKFLPACWEHTTSTKNCVNVPQVRSQLALFCTLKCPQHCSPVKQSPSQSNLCRLAIITIFIIASLHLLVQKPSIFTVAAAAMTIKLQQISD